MFNLKINETEFHNVKKELLKKKSYANQDISLDDLQQYYDNLRDNFSAQAFVTVSDDYFRKNKNTLFKELNNPDIKLQKVILDEIGAIKKDLTETFAISILNSYKEFNRNFYITKYSDNNEESQFKITCKDNFDAGKYNTVLNKILNEDMRDILAVSKKSYVEDNKKMLSGAEYLPVIKNAALAEFGNNENIYPALELLREEDIKQCIKEKFLEKKPLIEEYKE